MKESLSNIVVLSVLHPHPQSPIPSLLASLLLVVRDSVTRQHTAAVFRSFEGRAPNIWHLAPGTFTSHLASGN